MKAPEKEPTQVIRFDVELTLSQLERFDKILKRCYRSRKNFAEALIVLVIEANDNTIHLDKLGVVNSHTSTNH